MKLINYIIVAAGCFAMTACTSSDILNDVPNDTTTMTKVDDDLETIEIKLDVAGTLAEKLGDKKDKVQKMVLSGLVDADDVTTFRSMVKLTVLDMKGVEFAESEKTYSAAGTHTGCTHKLEKRTISEHMFANCQFASITLPDNIISINDGAFFKCYVNSITLPKGVKTIGENAFSDAGLLETVVLSESLTTIGSSAFLRCPLLTIKLPEKLTELGGHAFEQCTKLTSITIPNGVTTVNDNCFAGCEALEKVYLPSHLKTIGGNAFAGCPIKSIDIPETVIEIGSYAFAYNPALERIELPDNLQVISNSLFWKSSSLREVKLPAKLLKIEIFAFEDCEALKVVEIPSKTEIVQARAFASIWRLRAIIVNGKTTLNDIFEGPSNCLIYLSEPETNVSPNLDNIIINGVTPTLKLKDIWSDFFCPKEFKTQKATYTKTFDLKTIPGQSVGWYSLSLPFDVTTITHEDGRILAPFNSGVPNSHPFWLRKLTANGFENATSIKAGESYIIAMPNNEKYAKEYNLAGKITFSAQDAKNYITIPVTTYDKVEGPLFDFNRSYEYHEKNASVYVLNEAGSAFVRSLRDSKPFEAYVTNKNISTKAPDMFFIGSNVKTRSTHTISDKPSIDDM